LKLQNTQKVKDTGHICFLFGKMEVYVITVLGGSQTFCSLISCSH